MFRTILLSTCLAASWHTYATPVINKAPGFSFILLMAEFAPPAGCDVTILNADGTLLSGQNFDARKPFRVQLTNAQKQTDFVDVPETAIFAVTLDPGTGDGSTTYTAADGKTIVAQMAKAGPNLTSVQVGAVTCP